MFSRTLATYIGVDVEKIERLLAMPQSEIYEDEEYLSWIQQLEVSELDRTLALARYAYDRKLPELKQVLKEKYHLKHLPMSSYTLGSWIIGFLQYPHMAKNLIKLHTRLPREAVEDILPQLIVLLDDLPEGREHWQRALAVMALPLMGHRD